MRYPAADQAPLPSRQAVPRQVRVGGIHQIEQAIAVAVESESGSEQRIIPSNRSGSAFKKRIRQEVARAIVFRRRPRRPGPAHVEALLGDWGGTTASRLSEVAAVRERSS